jgi:ParB/RepB/Spo0J family partition protein
MPNIAAVQETETVVLIPLGQLHKSPFQPRRRDGDKLEADFVASIREKGVRQPIVVRERAVKMGGGGWEIVFGHRRHAGSVAAKRETIPAIVREMTDDEVFEDQLIENIHRNEMHPLDEADAFKRMLDRGRTAAQIADKIGRPASYVAQRLKLCELGKECRAALDKGDVSLGVAVVIARLPLAVQGEALKSLWHGIDAKQAKQRIETEYLLRLDQAPFDVTNATLVPRAGACLACPKRTGQQRELFADTARADMCIDRVCYRSKLDALWVIRTTEAKASGQDVLDGAAAAKAFGYGSGYKRLDEEEWDAKTSKHRKVRSLFGKDLPPVTLARDLRTGGIAELVKSADVDKVLKRKPPEKFSGSGMSKAAEAKQRQRAAAIDLTVTAAVAKVGALKTAQLVRLLTYVLVERTWNDSQMAVSRRRGLEKPRKGPSAVEGRLLAYLKTLTKANDVAGLGVELALRSIAPGKWTPSKPIWGETLKALGLKFETFERQVAAEAKAKKAKRR